METDMFMHLLKLDTLSIFNAEITCLEEKQPAGENEKYKLRK